MTQNTSTFFDRATRGLVAGGLGGLVGAGVKLLGEIAIPPRAPGEPIPPAVAVSRLLQALSGSPLLPEHTTIAVQSFHWTFSIAAGAIYGIVAEFVPFVRIGYGAGFGIVVLLMTHETTLPYFGFSLPWGQIPLKEHISELITHVMYGVSVELIRRLMRKQIFNDVAPATMLQT